MRVRFEVVLTAPNHPAPLAVASKEIKTDVMPYVGLEVEHIAFHDAKTVESILWSFDEDGGPDDSVLIVTLDCKYEQREKLHLPENVDQFVVGFNGLKWDAKKYGSL